MPDMGYCACWRTFYNFYRSSSTAASLMTAAAAAGCHQCSVAVWHCKVEACLNAPGIELDMIDLLDIDAAYEGVHQPTTVVTYVYACRKRQRQLVK
jgi:hypothetical protein